MVLILYLFKFYENDRDRSIKILKDTVIYFIFIPLTIYFSSHLIILFLHNKTWADIWLQQIAMVHIHLKQAPMFLYRLFYWWSWPLMIWPFWFYFQTHGDSIQAILCIGNPAIYWVVLPAVIYTGWRFRQKQLLLDEFLVGAFLSQWAAWIFIPRPQFFHYFETAVPFAIICIARILTKWWEANRLGKTVVLFYGILVVGLFIYWYPLLTAMPISKEFLYQHMWLKSWVLKSGFQKIALLQS